MIGEERFLDLALRGLGLPAGSCCSNGTRKRGWGRLIGPRASGCAAADPVRVGLLRHSLASRSLDLAVIFHTPPSGRTQKPKPLTQPGGPYGRAA